jgi:2-polyprenyl-6-methoxyphenol hydroxylase-like FAD-dependent oxidoreductase
VLAAEALRRRGLGEALDREHEIGLRALAREHGTTKAHFAWIHKLDPSAADPDRRGALIAQPALERLLRDHLVALGGTVRYGWAVTGCKQDDSGVTVTADTPTGPSQLTAAYVVGCDGGHSAVRRLAGFAFPGTDPLMTVRYAKAGTRHPDALPPSGRLPGGTLFHDDGMLATFDFTGAPADRDTPLTSDEMRESIRRVSGVDTDITEFHGGLRFTDQARQAETYRLGRVLLAGDAAHVHSPNGGQGLNLGLMDATNLGWKLAATVRGTAPAGPPSAAHTQSGPSSAGAVLSSGGAVLSSGGAVLSSGGAVLSSGGAVPSSGGAVPSSGGAVPSSAAASSRRSSSAETAPQGLPSGDPGPLWLLDTYHHERHPVGASVLHNTRAQSALLAPGPHVDALRDIFGDLMELPEVNAYLSRLLSGVTHRYPMPYPVTHPLVGLHCPPDLEGAAVLLRPDGVIAWAAGPGAFPAAEPWAGSTAEPAVGPTAGSGTVSTSVSGAVSTSESAAGPGVGPAAGVAADAEGRRLAQVVWGIA